MKSIVKKLFSTRPRIVSSFLVLALLIAGGAFGFNFIKQKISADIVQGDNYAVSSTNPVWFNEYLLNKEVWNKYLDEAEKNPADTRTADQNDCNVTGQLFWANLMASFYEPFSSIDSSNPNSNALIKTCWNKEHLDELYEIFWPEYADLRTETYFSLPEIDRIVKIKKHKDRMFQISGTVYENENPLTFFVFPSRSATRLVSEAVTDSYAGIANYIKLVFGKGDDTLILLTEPSGLSAGKTAAQCVESQVCTVDRIGREFNLVKKSPKESRISTITRDTKTKIKSVCSIVSSPFSDYLARRSIAKLEAEWAAGSILVPQGAFKGLSGTEAVSGWYVQPRINFNKAIVNESPWVLKNVGGGGECEKLTLFEVTKTIVSSGVQRELREITVTPVRKGLVIFIGRGNASIAMAKSSVGDLNFHLTGSNSITFGSSFYSTNIEHMSSFLDELIKTAEGMKGYLDDYVKGFNFKKELEKTRVMSEENYAEEFGSCVVGAHCSAGDVVMTDTGMTISGYSGTGWRFNSAYLHELNHAVNRNLDEGLDYLVSGNTRINHLNEGFTEFIAKKIIISTTGDTVTGNAYSKQVYVVQEIYNKLISKYGQEQGSKIFFDSYYSKGIKSLDEYFGSGFYAKVEGYMRAGNWLGAQNEVRNATL